MQARPEHWAPTGRTSAGSTPRLVTGIPGFDSISKGGVPRGRTTLDEALAA